MALHKSKMVHIVLDTKFRSSVTVMEVVSSEGHVLLTNFFLQSLRVNVTTYIEVLDMAMKLWINGYGCKYFNKTLLSPL